MDFAQSVLTHYAAAVLSWGAVFVALSALELAVPRGARQPMANRLQGLAFWVVWWAVSKLWLEFYRVLWTRLGVQPIAHLDFDAMGAWAGPLAGVVVALLSVAFSDLLFYGFHRAQHAVPWLWRRHAVHHSVRELNAVNSYHHVSETVLRSALTVLPLSWLQVDATSGLMLIAVLAQAQVVYIHSPTRLHFGPLGRVFADNRFHRIHHSLEPQHFDRNFGANVTLWDWLFGTAYFPKPGEWPAVGLAEVDEPHSFRQWLNLPYRYPKRAASAAASAAAE